MAETVLETGKPSRTILEYTEEHDVDHIMGSRDGSGIERCYSEVWPKPSCADHLFS